MRSRRSLPVAVLVCESSRSAQRQTGRQRWLAPLADHPLRRCTNVMKTLFLALLSAMLLLNVTGCEGSYHLNATFHKVQQLKEGDPVLMEGIQVGRVDRITLDPRQGNLIVSLKIKRSVVVKTDAIAVIKATVSAGKNVVVLEGGSDLAPAATESTHLMIKELPSH